jgi:hypothetical protein
MNERGGGVIGMDLIEQAALAVVALDGGLAFEQILQNEGASGAIDAGETGHGSGSIQSDVFGFAQQRPVSRSGSAKLVSSTVSPSICG